MKHNKGQGIAQIIGGVGLVIGLFLLISNTSALFGQAAIDEISAPNADDTVTLSLLPPVAWLEKHGLPLDEFVQQLRQRFEINVENAGSVQEMETTPSPLLHGNEKQPVAIAVRNAGATQTLTLFPPANQQAGSNQSEAITVQQAGAQSTLLISAAPAIAPSLPMDTEIQVKQAGYTRGIDLVEPVWP